MSPTVSVIIPNYNHAPYLRQRIDSVLQQDYQDFEVILLDDCSKDDSRQVLENYRDHPKVSHVVYNEQNTGNTFIQWERGINLAEGQYIWIAESDDVAERNFLSTLIPQLEADDSRVVAYSHSRMIDSNGEPLPQTWHKKGSSGAIIVHDGKTFNVGGKETWSYEELARMFFAAAGKKPVISRAPVWLFDVLAWVNKKKKNGKEAIIRFSKWTLTEEMVGDTKVGDASFAEYIRSCYAKK